MEFLGTAKNPAVIFGVLTLMFYVGTELGFSSWLVNYLEKTHAFQKLQASLALSILWIGLITGRLTNTFILRWVSGRLILAVSSVLGVVFGTLFLFVSAPPAAS